MDINFQSVFDNNVEEEKAFDTIFGAEEDDELMATVLGEDAISDEEFYAMLGEEGDLPDMNTLDDGASVKELEKDVVGEEIDAPKCEPSETVPEPDKVDSEKDTPGENIACPQAGVADAVENREPDEEKLEDEIDKAENKVDLEESFLAAILGEEFVEEEAIEETDTKINYDTAADAGDESKDETEEKCHKEGDGCEDGECEDKNDSEIAPDATTAVVVDIEDDDDDDEDENLDDVFSDEGEEDDDEIDTENCSKNENVEEIEDNQTPEIEDNTEVNDDSQLDGEPGLPGEVGMDDEEVGLESAEENLDDIFAESTDETEEEKAEDELIDAAEDDAEMSDAEVAALVSKDEEDDLLDAIIGE